ncbi:MAG: type II toxin-antitoxin system death-on-curing family toxin [Flavobacteriales bacterium]|nr:type II toxin-antitoxin system death-on-curing family toxin [Flavobacteriales bacterium]
MIRRFGGSVGIRDAGLLDAALNRPYATFGGMDLFPAAVDKAAAIMHGIITGHPFLDGNKRTGYVLGRLILQQEGSDIQADEDDRYDMVIRVATGQLDVDGIKAWMLERVVPFRS